MLDFTQAFDMIAHDLMVCKMRVSQRYFDGATALLGHSTTMGIEYGVPQGSVLGPLMFISFIDDVSGVIHFCRFLIYADDLQIYHSSSVADLQRCYDEVNADLKRIYDWAGSNGLKLNSKNSQVILIQKGGW
jgi:ribonucleases P/MRP protein subunit RPP40